MADNNTIIPNVMPDAMVEPITDMELIVAKLKHDGASNQNSMENNPDRKNTNKEV